MSDRTEAMLGEYRVLDLTDEKGLLCGKMLGDLGADVIKIEKPGGDSARNIGPFYHDIPDPEKSLFWFAFNTNKRSITLDIETIKGQEMLKKLVRSADFLIESFPPGYLDSLGLGYSSLNEINPRIIVAAITPFGQTGPYKDFKGSDLVCMALSGHLYLTGDPERPPVRVTMPQAYLHAASEATVGALFAHWHRERTGQGQFVDVSAQECATWACFHSQMMWNMNNVNMKRHGAWRRLGFRTARTLFPCKDGHVCFIMFGGHIGAKGQQRLVEWMDSEGMADDFLRDFDWISFDAGTFDEELANKLEPRWSDFFATKTKAELFDGAIRLQYMMAPVNTTENILENAQLESRDYWVEVQHPELDATLTYPGAPYKSSELPWEIWRRAPLIGEHNEEIYRCELGFSEEEIAALREAKVI